MVQLRQQRDFKYEIEDVAVSRSSVLHLFNGHLLACPDTDVDFTETSFAEPRLATDADMPGLDVPGRPRHRASELGEYGRWHRPETGLLVRSGPTVHLAVVFFGLLAS